MGGGKRKDGKEGEVQGDEMERKEEKNGENLQLLGRCRDDSAGLGSMDREGVERRVT